MSLQNTDSGGFNLAFPFFGGRKKQNAFIKHFKSVLKGYDFSLGKEIRKDVFEIANDSVSAEIDVRDARREFEYGQNSRPLDDLIKKTVLDCSSKTRLASFHHAQTGLRFILSPTAEVSENLISMPFIDDMSKILAFCSDDGSIFEVNKEQAQKWEIPADVLFNVADRNMCEIFRKLELRVTEITNGIKVIEFTDAQPEFCASMLACSDFRRIIGDRLGSKFIAIAPSKRTLLAVEDVTNDFLECFGPVVMREYESSPYKLSTGVFLISPGRISVIGKFHSSPENEGAEY